jgi:hypothetical protein
MGPRLLARPLEEVDRGQDMPEWGLGRQKMSVYHFYSDMVQVGGMLEKKVGKDDLGHSIGGHDTRFVTEYFRKRTAMLLLNSWTLHVS